MVLSPHIDLQWRALTVLLVKLFDEFLFLRRLRQRLDVCIKLCQSRLCRVCDVRQRRALPIHKTEHRISRSAVTHTLIQLQ